MAIYLCLLGKLCLVRGKQTFKKHCTATCKSQGNFHSPLHFMLNNTANGHRLDNLFNRNSIFLP